MIEDEAHCELYEEAEAGQETARRRVFTEFGAHAVLPKPNPRIEPRELEELHMSVKKPTLRALAIKSGLIEVGSGLNAEAYKMSIPDFLELLEEKFPGISELEEEDVLALIDDLDDEEEKPAKPAGRGRGKAAPEEPAKPAGRGRGRGKAAPEPEPEEEEPEEEPEEEAPKGRRGRGAKAEEPAKPAGRGRGRAAKEPEPEPEPAPTGRGRGRGRAKDPEPEPEEAKPTGRGRGRGRAVAEEPKEEPQAVSIDLSSIEAALTTLRKKQDDQDKHLASIVGMLGKVIEELTELTTMSIETHDGVESLYLEDIVRTDDSLADIVARVRGE